MLDKKRITIICGHYGSGKSTVAVAHALRLAKQQQQRVVLADLDIVNPYFRSADHADQLKAGGVEVICSAYANSNLDFPALPREIYTIVNDRTARFVLDIGGDERGALVLGRLSKAIKEENNYEMLAVINMYRPLTQTAPDTVEILREIEKSAKINFTAVLNNSNLGAETTQAIVADSTPYAQQVATLMSIPLIKLN
ncbi:MAG: hypothetical protein FWH03_05935 [Firmicutes bacterium]|nr:hypothetical protein [Bacillota bacterium]